MSKSLNRVELIGFFGGDPELKFTPSGAAVATFSVATNQSWKDKEGNQKEEVEWHRLVVWNKLAEVVAEYCKKGQQVYVAGRLKTRSWTDKDQVKRYTTEIVVNEVIFLGGGKGVGKETPPTPSEESAPPMTSEERNDLPF
jgi:single-strand DNA-binding protein